MNLLNTYWKSNLEGKKKFYRVSVTKKQKMHNLFIIFYKKNNDFIVCVKK